MKYSPMLDYEDIAGHMKEARVVGIGESTHGTHEFFQTKVELCKILIERIDSSIILNRFIEEMRKSATTGGWRMAISLCFIEA